MWAVATLQRTNMPPSISMQRITQSCVRLSLAKRGVGVTSTKLPWSSNNRYCSGGRTFSLHKTEFRCHANKIRNRVSLHLLHDTAPLHFDGCFAGTQFTGNLLVQQTGNHQAHHVTFTASQCGKTFP